MPFKFIELRIKELILVEPQVFFDDRGYMLNSYRESDFFSSGIDYKFVQDNYSFSRKNVIRGLHYQLNPKAQGKLISVIKGAAWDVAVDIRKGSPTFSKWIGIELTEDNKKMLFIPPGFAHGFVALTDDLYLTYKCTEEYAPDLNTGIRWNDPDIDIKWPIAIETAVVSEKDKSLPFLKKQICLTEH